MNREIFSTTAELLTKRLEVTNVGEVRSELEVVDELGASLLVTLYTEAQDGSEAVLEVLLGQSVAGVRLETSVRDPRYLRVLLEPLSNLEGVVYVTLNAQRERLDTLQQQEGSEGVDGGSKVTQNDDARVDGKSDGAECVPELEAVVALGGLSELWEAAALGPVELARVDNDTSEGRAGANVSYEILESCKKRAHPPMVVPWPPIHLVAECTTMSAPCSMGLIR